MRRPRITAAAFAAWAMSVHPVWCSVVMAWSVYGMSGLPVPFRWSFCRLFPWLCR